MNLKLKKTVAAHIGAERFYYHEEGVSYPEAPPAGGTAGDGHVLTVDGHGLGGGLTHGTPGGGLGMLNVYTCLPDNEKAKSHTVPADVRLDLRLGHRHHGYGCGCGEPVGFVVAAGVIADLVGGAVEEGDGAEPGEAGSWLAWRDDLMDLL